MRHLLPLGAARPQTGRQSALLSPMPTLPSWNPQRLIDDRYVIVRQRWNHGCAQVHTPAMPATAHDGLAHRSAASGRATSERHRVAQRWREGS